MFYSPLEQFAIISYVPVKFPMHLFFPGSFEKSIDLSITNSAAFIALSMVFFLICLEVSYPKVSKEQFEKNLIWAWFRFRNPEVAPHISEAIFAPAAEGPKQLSGVQNILEMLYVFLRDLLKEQVGDSGMPYFPIIFTIFVFILNVNLIGMMPLGFTATSHFVITFGLSVPVFIGVTIIGFLHHGIHFLSFLLPPGAPLVLAPMLVVLEFVSYNFRAISLGVRLFANMMAGHTLVIIIAGFAHTLLGHSDLSFNLIGVIPFAVVWALIGLELGVAALQAYVFTILTCIYLNDAIALH